MKSIRRFAVLISCCVLSGCFLQQDPPQPQGQPVTPAITTDGLVTLVDVREGNRGGAELDAVFGPHEAGGGQATPAQSRVQQRRWLHRILTRQRSVIRGTDCQRQKGTPAPSSPDTTVYYDAGAVTFGPDLQTTFEPVQEDPTSHLYSLTDLVSPFPTGDYQFQTAGTKQVPAIAAELAIPEPLDGVTVNGTSIAQSGFTISRGQPLQVEWNPPDVPNDQNIMLLVLESQNSTEIEALQCQGLETDVSGSASSVASWSIDPEWLADLIDGSGAQLYFIREISLKGTSGTLQMELDGVRIWNTRVTIGD